MPKTVPTTPSSPDPSNNPGDKGERGTSALPIEHDRGYDRGGHPHGTRVNYLGQLVNRSPIAAFTVTPTSGTVTPATVFTADVTPSRDDALGLTHSIAWGDGTTVTPTETAPTVTKSYATVGTKTITLTTTDSDGVSSTATQTVTVA